LAYLAFVLVGWDGMERTVELFAAIRFDQACRILRLPTIRDRHGEVAAAAARQQVSYKGLLVELLSLECDDRETCRKARLVREAGFPRPKWLEDFDYAANPNVPAALIATLAKGAWVAAGQLRPQDHAASSGLPVLSGCSAFAVSSFSSSAYRSASSPSEIVSG
jgi:hypothetical protein